MDCRQHEGRLEADLLYAVARDPWEFWGFGALGGGQTIGWFGTVPARKCSPCREIRGRTRWRSVAKIQSNRTDRCSEEREPTAAAAAAGGGDRWRFAQFAQMLLAGDRQTPTG